MIGADTMYRVGLVGCGGIAQVHAKVLRGMTEAQLVACADVRIDRAVRMMNGDTAHAYDSLEKMLDAEQLDVVHICTPHYLHTPMAVQCAARGVAVFMEKPPVISREQWTQLTQAAQQAPLGVCFQNRYNANVLAAHEMIASGEYGALKGVRGVVCWSRDAAYYTDSDWRGRWETEGGGALMNQTIHTLDLLLGFTGPADRIEAHMANRHLKGISEEEDTVEAYWTSGEVSAVFLVSTAYAANAPVLVELVLEKATLRVEGDSVTIQQGIGTEVRRYPMESGLGKDYWGSGHDACIRDFYASLPTGKTFRNDLASVADTVDALLEIYAQGRREMNV